MIQELTERQQQTLDVIRMWVRDRGTPPTLREIGEVMNIRSTNGVTDHLRALERKGYIRRSDTAKARSVQLCFAEGLVECNCAEVRYLRERVAELEDRLARIREAV